MMVLLIENPKDALIPCGKSESREDDYEKFARYGLCEMLRRLSYFLRLKQAQKKPDRPMPA
jgi:hypothetical protein